LLRCLKADYADPMTDDRMVLIGLIEKSVDTDLVARGVRDPARQVQSNGYWSAGFLPTARRRSDRRHRRTLGFRLTSRRAD
jgi:hypothetical protein